MPDVHLREVLAPSKPRSIPIRGLSVHIREGRLEEDFSLVLLNHLPGVSKALFKVTSDIIVACFTGQSSFRSRSLHGYYSQLAISLRYVCELCRTMAK